jgi:hypothetical protein
MSNTKPRNRYYVGRADGVQKPIALTTRVMPTENTHFEFRPIVGPFRTIRGRNYYMRHADKCRTVGDAERLALKGKIDAL